MRRMNLKSVLVGLSLAALGGVMLGAAGGCYERVINAKGLGADQYQVSEPYQENSKLDDWIFGPQQPKKSKSLLP